MSRINNDSNFELTELIGKRLSRLLGATESEDDCVVEMMFLQVHGDKQWYRMFLQAGLGFWEIWNEKEAFYDYTEHRLVDFGKRWDVLGQTIILARCIGGEHDDSELSRFEIMMTNGTLRFNFQDPKDLTSDTVLQFETQPQIGT